MLDRFRILDLTDDRGHFCGMIMAQLGAEVIAIEPPEGQRSRYQGPFAGDVPDPEKSLTHWAYNRAKQSLVLDLNEAEDLKRLEELAATADALVASDGSNVDLESLSRRYPHLVTAFISGFGGTGPKSDWAASDIVNTAASGTMGITGDRDRAPVRLSLPQTWHFAASDALCGILLALRERESSGLGQHVDVAAQHSYLIASQYQMLYPFVGAPSTRRLSGGAEIGPITLKLVYEAADGFLSIVFLVGPTVGPYNTRLFEWMDEEGMCPDEFRDVDWIGFGTQLLSDPEAPGILNRGAEVINEFTKTKTKAELLDAALERNLLLGPITTTRELLDMEHAAERDFWRSIDGVRFAGPIARLSDTTLVTETAPPKLDEHNVGAREQPAVPAEPNFASDVDPMKGIKVLDMTWAIAGPYASRIMGDFGADVLRIESELKPCIMRGAGPFVDNEAGADNSLSYLSINASKRSLAIDLRDPRSIQIMEELVEWADVLIESYSVGVIGRMGLGYEHLKTINPELIMVSTSLMGQTGPIREISGFGNIGAAVAGFFPFGGWPDRQPCGPFGAYSDYISPRLTLALVLAALDERERSGHGQHIDYSQMEAAAQLLSPAFLADEINGVEGSRIGNSDANFCPHGAYPVLGDDRWIAVACETQDQWEALSQVVGAQHLASLTSEERRERHHEIDSLISDWTGQQDGIEAEAALQKLQVPAHRVLYAPEVAEDPQLRYRKAFSEVSHPHHGQVWIEDSAIHLSRTPGSARWAAPPAGEHLYEVLTDILGRDSDEAAELIATGIFT
ncbi:MAG: CoA transferase [Acidimicrobiales bacterium]|nr:CoA transferase [Acidimicrobiales bacterium]